MEKTPENDKESSHSAHANGMNEKEMPNICGPCRTELAAHHPSSTQNFEAASGFLEIVSTLALKYILDKWERHVSHFQSAFH
jgi:hypothetical protein